VGVGQPRRAHERGGPRQRAGRRAGPCERRRGVDRGQHRGARAPGDDGVGRHEPHAVGGRGGLGDGARGGAQLVEDAATAGHRAGAERVVEHDRDRRGGVPRPADPSHRPRRGEGDEQDDEHPEQHEQQVVQPGPPAALLLGPHEVAHCGELEPRARAPPEQVDEERDGDAGREREVERREEAHARAIACRAAKARRSGIPNGSVVSTTS
jgi:hypothetical protein